MDLARSTISINNIKSLLPNNIIQIQSLEQENPVNKEKLLNNLIRGSNFARKTKASFAGCPISDRKLFSQSSCLLPISMTGSREHEDKRFMATMQLVNISFKSCTILIVDSLYRHTIKLKNPEVNDEDLYHLAIKRGDEWLERNKNAYENLTIPNNIKRWDEYLQHTNFQEKLDIVSNLYETDKSYKEAIDTNVEQYLARYLNRLPETDRKYNDQETFAYCVHYLKEECAGMCLWYEGGYNFEIYPTGRCIAMAATYEKLIKPNYPNLLRPVSIRFKKYNILKNIT